MRLGEASLFLVLLIVVLAECKYEYSIPFVLWSKPMKMATKDPPKGTQRPSARTALQHVFLVLRPSYLGFADLLSFTRYNDRVILQSGVRLLQRPLQRVLPVSDGLILPVVSDKVSNKGIPQGWLTTAK
ncbi:hypothetical protein QR680_015771 [Steinernema hermaphroditum]|uniref:Secreted protein n=1 Tax=Steinernema hermaphroditum TaxID=289476 RepID=A0AA39H9W0_9BILA|nr:hypothetical protein QR680_015771 [Steinernema hermaphroditum]